MPILDTAMRPASPRGVLAADQRWWPEALPTRVASRGLRIAEDYRTRPERRLGRRRQDTILSRATFCIRNYQNRAN